MLALNRPERRPLARPRLGVGFSRLFRFKGRSDEAGCLATVEVELEFETPSHLTPQASSPPPHLKRIARPSPGPPSPHESTAGAIIRASARIRHSTVTRSN